jgi:hypothetical protein
VAYGFDETFVIGTAGSVQQGFAACEQIAFDLLQSLWPASFRRFAQQGFAMRRLGVTSDAE